jgi:hypothetical protein
MSNFEEDFSWLPSIDDVIDFEIGADYHIKSGNNWETYTYVGYDPAHKMGFGDTPNITYPVYIFQAKHGKSYKSEGYVKDLVARGLIKAYDPDFNFYKQLNVKKINIENLKPNFVIIFRNGVDVQDTYDLQTKLLEMGYTWYHRGERLITPKDVKDKIYTIESVNWDVSNSLYSRMNSTFGDRKILMLSTFDDLETEGDKERRLNFILDHPQVQVVDGDDLLSKI